MKKKNSSIDGFVPRRSINSNRVGGLDVNNHGKPTEFSDQKTSSGLLARSDDRSLLVLHNKNDENNDVGSDISESLRNLEDLKPKNDIKMTRKQRRQMKKSLKKPKKKWQKILRWVILVIIIAALGVGGFLVYKVINAGGSILQGNIFDIVKTTPLEEDENGRSNFLILGTSEDDPDHPGGNLTDSMMIVSVDQDNKNVYIFSIPRDLYVQYGMACAAGYSGKINSYFSCVNDGETSEDEQARLTQTMDFIGNIFGLDIQYGVHVNQTVLKDAVDAVGGIDVDIEGSNGDSGILDRNFDWRCNYECYYVKYDNGVHHLDGTHALFLAQARGDVAPTYGLSNSNFDREKNQQKILIALRDKALSSGTLTDISAVTKLIDALGNNLRTNIKTDEIRTIMNVAADTDSSNIITLSLIDDDLVTTGSYNGASVVMPSAGIYDYSDLQAYIAKNFSSNPVEREDASVAIYNATETAGLAQTKADELTEQGFNIAEVDNAPEGDYSSVKIYQIGDGNTATAAKLESIYNVDISTDTPPFDVNDGIDFVIIFGSES